MFINNKLAKCEDFYEILNGWCAKIRALCVGMFTREIGKIIAGNAENQFQENILQNHRFQSS